MTFTYDLLSHPFAIIKYSASGSIIGFDKNSEYDQILCQNSDGDFIESQKYEYGAFSLAYDDKAGYMYLQMKSDDVGSEI